MTLTRIFPLVLLGLYGYGASIAACNGDDSTAPASDASVTDASKPLTEAGDAGSSAVSLTGGPQTPPTGGANVEAWLATGAYKQWQGEPAVHPARSPSPHGFNRIYSNAIISANAGGTGVWPVGAAAVKELYNAITDATPMGYAVYLKTQPDSAGGANWYWYERVPATSTAPHDDAGVVADGFGVPGGGPPTTICVGCHAAAGSDAPHTPSAGGRDEVYTPVGNSAEAGSDASSAAEGSTTSSDAASDALSSTGGPQTPPMGGANVEAWLAMGAYKQWHDEPAIHAARSPSPHGFNRIYSNAVISANVGGTGAWPVGAAAVKELYNALTDTMPVGYAVYLKAQPDSAGGANWYWYERVPAASTAPHDDAGVVADGFGVPDGGPPTTICVGCHAAAGSDAPHTPSTGGRDEVYTPVP